MDIYCGFKRCTVLSSYFNFNPDNNGKKVEKNRQGSLKSSVFKMIRFENMSWKYKLLENQLNKYWKCPLEFVDLKK